MKNIGTALLFKTVTYYQIYSWLFVFVENMKNLGNHTIKVQVVLNESGVTEFGGKPLPSHKIKFSITGNIQIHQYSIQGCFCKVDLMHSRDSKEEKKHAMELKSQENRIWRPPIVPPLIWSVTIKINLFMNMTTLTKTYISFCCFHSNGITTWVGDIFTGWLDVVFIENKKYGNKYI